MKTRSKSRKSPKGSKPNRSRSARSLTPPTSSPKSEKLESSPDVKSLDKIQKTPERIRKSLGSTNRSGQRSVRLDLLESKEAKADRQETRGEKNVLFAPLQMHSSAAASTLDLSDEAGDNPFLAAKSSAKLVACSPISPNRTRLISKRESPILLLSKSPYATPPSHSHSKALVCPGAPVKIKAAKPKISRGIVHRHAANIKGVRLFAETDDKLAEKKPDSRNVESLLYLFSDRDSSSDSDHERAETALPEKELSSGYQSFWKSGSGSHASAVLKEKKLVSTLLHDDSARKERLKSLRSYTKARLLQRKPLAALEVG